jgi:hypothetical protein
MRILVENDGFGGPKISGAGTGVSIAVEAGASVDAALSAPDAAEPGTGVARPVSTASGSKRTGSLTAFGCSIASASKPSKTCMQRPQRTCPARAWSCAGTTR